MQRTATTVLATVLIAAFGPLAPAARGGTRLAAEIPARGDAPHVVYSTLLGGAAGEFDGAADVAVDRAGNAIVVGTTESSDFPIKSALQDSLEGGSDAFIAKFAPDGTLIFSTFLGGDERDSCSAVAVDAEGAIYVAGSTASPDFPVKDGFQITKAAVTDAFVAKLTPDGSSIVWASYLGGSGIDSVRDLAVDGQGLVYVAGQVVPVSGGSATFPSVNQIQATYGGGGADGFVSVITQNGVTLGFSTLLDFGVQGNVGMDGTDRISTISVDSTSGDVFVAGNVETSEDEPEIAAVARFRRAPARTGNDAGRAPPQIVYEIVEQLGTDEDLEPPEQFSAKIILPWLMGNLFADRPEGRTAGPFGASPDVNVLFEGLCHPVAPSSTCNEPAAFATLDPNLNLQSAANMPLLREFFFEAGGTDSQGAVYIAGDIDSDDVTTVNPVQAAFGGNDDAVIAVLEPGTLNKAMVTYFGGDGYDSPTAMALDADGNIFVVGLTTLSTTFPTTPGALQTTPKGRNDGFLVKISAVGPFAEAPDFSLSFTEPTVNVTRGQKVTIPMTITRVGGFDGKVKVSPPPQVPGFKSPKKSPSVPGTTLALKFKIKTDAPLGATSFTFTGRDNSGRERTATVTLNVQ